MQVYTEALGIYYSLITTVFFDKHKLVPFLRTLSSRTRQTLRQIRCSMMGSTDTAGAAQRLQRLYDLIDESGLGDDLYQSVLGLR